MSGWVKLWRTAKDHPCLGRADALGVWAYLLMQAASKPCTLPYRGKPTQFDQGELAISIVAFAEKMGITHKRMRLILELFEREGMVEVRSQKGKPYSVIKVLNYKSFQASEKDEGQSEGKPRANPGQTEQERKKNPSPIGEGRAAPSARSVLWDEMKARIGGKDPGALIGMWLRDYGEGPVFAAHFAALRQETPEYVKYVTGVLRKQPKRDDAFNGKHGPAPAKAKRVQVGEEDPLADEHLAPFSILPRSPLAEMGAR